MNFVKELVFLLISLSLLPAQKVMSQNKFALIFKENQQSIGVQINPYFYDITDVSYQRYNSKVYAVRYFLTVYKKLSIGTEVSGMNYAHNDNRYKYSRTNIGFLARCNFLNEKQISLLIESIVYYQYGKYYHSVLPQPNWKENKVNWYSSAGIRINLYKHKVSLDLMIKYSPDVKFEGTKFVPTYKINYHIN